MITGQMVHVFNDARHSEYHEPKSGQVVAWHMGLNGAYIALVLMDNHMFHQTRYDHLEVVG